MATTRYYPYATPGAFNGTATYPEGWEPKDGKEFSRFVQDWLKWMEQSEVEMSQLYSSIAWRVMLGVSTCEELQRYNGQAIGLYLSQESVRNTLIAAGLSSIPPAPFPRLFADSLIDRDVSGVRTIAANIRCTSDGYPSAALQINPARCPAGVSTPALGIAMIAAVPWGTAVVLIAKGFFVALAGWGVAEIFRAFPSTARNQMRVDMDAGHKAAEVRWSNNVNTCIKTELRGLTPTQMANIPLRRKITEACVKQRPRPTKPPELEKGFSLKGLGKGLLWVALGAAGIYGAYYGIQRLREQ